MQKRIVIIPIVVLLLIAAAVILELYPSNKITGQATTTIQQIIENQPHSIVIGTYSIRPSFSVDLDYDLNVYDKIEEAINQINSQCPSQKDIENCVNTEILKFNLKEGSARQGYPLSVGCYEGDEGVFMDFVDYISNCSSSTENSCECIHQHISEAEYKLSQSPQGIIIDAVVNKNKSTATIKNAKIIAPLTFSSALNYRLARDKNGAILVVRKGDIGKECNEKSYQRKTYTFCYNTGKKLIIADQNNKIIEKEHKIRFAVEFP